MIEILSEPKPVETKGTLMPRNIRQKGQISGDSALYMEDYVYRFLHKKERQTGKKTCVLLGELQWEKEKRRIFVKGALALDTISYGGGWPVFSEDMWDEIYRQCRKYFPEWSIVGWSFQVVGTVFPEEAELKRISSRHFPSNHGTVFLYDAYDEWEHVYMDDNGKLRLEQGYYIYYEKNSPMSHYLSDYHAKEKEVMEHHRDLEKFLVHDETRFDENRKEEMEAMARYRAYMNGQKERSYQQRMKAAISIAVVVLVLLSGVLVQNYDRVSKMQETVETISKKEEAKEAQEAVIEETVEKKAKELANVTEEVAAPAAPAEENPYLAQGYYLVEKGDKLLDISRKVYGNDQMVQAICEKNQLENGDHIQEGDKLLLP